MFPSATDQCDTRAASTTDVLEVVALMVSVPIFVLANAGSHLTCLVRHVDDTRDTRPA